MADDTETRRPHDRDPNEEQAPTEQRSQDELNRSSRSSGGDAAAAGSIEEREAVARDEDDVWGDGPDGPDKD